MALFWFRDCFVVMFLMQRVFNEALVRLEKFGSEFMVCIVERYSSADGMFWRNGTLQKVGTIHVFPTPFHHTI